MPSLTSATSHRGWSPQSGMHASPDGRARAPPDGDSPPSRGCPLGSRPLLSAAARRATDSSRHSTWHAWCAIRTTFTPSSSRSTSVGSIGGSTMSNSTVGDAAIAVVRRNAEEVQGKGNWDLFEKLFADDFVDHTPQPGTTPDKNGVRVLYKRLRAAFPDFRPEIHWQVAAAAPVAPYKTPHDAPPTQCPGISGP